MRKAVGPVLTTGVALTAAAVIVANPVAPPIRDMQISTTQLSTSPQELIPFDKSLLNSIAPPPPSSFDAALAQILGALAAEADRISSGVISEAAGAQAPAANTTVTTDTAPQPPNGTPSVAAVPPAASSIVTPAVQQVFSSLAQDAAYLGNKVVEAAHAAVRTLVNTQQLIAKAVLAVFRGDLAAVLNAAAEAVKAFFGPGLGLVGDIEVLRDQLRPHARPLDPVAATLRNPATATAETPTTAGNALDATDKLATDPEPATVAEPGSGRKRDAETIAGHRRATAQPIPAPRPFRADAGPSAVEPPADGPESTPRHAPRPPAPGTGNRAERPAARTAGGADRPAAGSAKDQGAGKRGSVAE